MNSVAVTSNIDSTLASNVIKNTKDFTKPDIYCINAYGYELMYLNINGKKMFCLFNIIQRYSEINHKRIDFYGFIRYKGTLNRINILANLNNKTDTPYKITSIKELNIPGIICKYNFNGYNLSTSTNKNNYIVCEYILNLFLMWMDDKIACATSMLLERLRNNKINMLEEELAKVNDAYDKLKKDSGNDPEYIAELKSRYTSHPDTESWTVFVGLEMNLHHKIMYVNLGYRNQSRSNRQHICPSKYLCYVINVVCGHDIRLYCLKTFKEIMSKYNAKHVPKSSRKLELSFKDYCDPDYYKEYIEDKDLDNSLKLKDIKPNKNMLQDLVNMFTISVESNEWKDTKIFSMA